MATQAFLSVIDHTSTAGFLAWGSEWNAKHAAAGLVQISLAVEPGQINWATATRPGINTIAGYEIWQMNDSIAGAYPIYFKIEYGTDSLANVPAIYMTVGTGSNGSGGLTGQLSTRSKITKNLAPSSTTTTWMSYLCVTEGAYNILWKVAAPNVGISALGNFRFERTLSDDGSMNGIGYRIYVPTGTNADTQQCVRVASPAVTYPLTAKWGVMILAGQTSSDDGMGHKQAFLHEGVEPVARLLFATNSVFSAEYGVGIVFSLSLPWFLSPKTYLSWGAMVGGDCTSTSSTTMGVAVIWE